MNIPFHLKQNLEAGSCVLFVGAGMGHHMQNDKGEKIPDAKNLAKMMAEEFAVPIVDNYYDLAKISEYIVVTRKGRKELIAFIQQCLIEAQPDEYMSWIPTIKWKAIFTTNYDNCIQKAYNQHESPVQNYVTITRSTGIRQFNSNIEVPIYHLHGALFEESSPDIIITQHDYTKYKTQRKMMFEQLKQFMAASCVLYIGYSHNDPNWNTLWADIEEEFLPEVPPLSYRIDPFASTIDIEILKAKNLVTIPIKYDDFVNKSLLEVIPQYNKDSGFEQLKSQVPSNLLEHFKENPTSIVRMLSSWEYLNQITLTNTIPSVFNYVRGDKPSWDIIFSESYFERDIEEEVYDSLLDFVTDTNDRVKTCILSGPAGYGTSTLLMTLGARLVKDRAAEVYFHKPNSDLREGDLFHAVSLSKEKTIFIIDNAADHTKTIKTILQQARETKKSLLLLLGDRLNEWRQARPQITGDTFEIQTLSDSEIEGLLDFLGKHNELHKLEFLSREHQVSAIKRNYQRELLVVIREATEDKDIEAILYDEYYGIKDDFARKVYAHVCCFHQHDAKLRVELLSNLLGVNAVTLFQRIKGYLDGVIVDECINESKGEYVLRARHRIIASIVWDRCLETPIKDLIIHQSLDKMNILYGVDKKAFESFIRSDRIVDSLITLESKIKFFDKACTKDPDNPFVRQHYARMFIRTENETSALRIIEEAINMDPTIRSLYHTKGYILHQTVLNSDSKEIGIRRLLQSEEAYYTGIKMNPSDEYCYQGLAQLYLAWARNVSDDEERTTYLNKAEEIINTGMKKVKNKEALWIESANIDSFLGDHPARIRSLEAAVSVAPESIISRYLLAKAYNLNNQFDKSIEILSTLTRDHPNEYRPSIEYAFTILKNGGEFNQAIAVLNQSTLFGYSDPVFVATFGGLLFLNKEFTKAENVFFESQKREFALARSILFDPEVRIGKKIEYEATVKYVGNSYSYLVIPGYPDIYCRFSKYHGLVLTRGLKVRATIVFTPREPIISKVEAIEAKMNKVNLGLHIKQS